MDGTHVNEWVSPTVGEQLFMGEPLTAGKVISFSRPPQQGSNGSRTVFELDWDNNVLWSYVAEPEVWAFHHDIERLPNGNTLILINKHIDIGLPTELEDDSIIEVDPAGNVVWEWNTIDHLAEFGFTPIAAQHAIASLPLNLGDWAHANSATTIPPNNHSDPAFTPGNIIVSARSTNMVFIIDRATGAVVWKTDPHAGLSMGQHHATMIEQGLQGAGNILIYDNGSGTGYGLTPFGRGFSRVIEIDPVTQAIVWDYKASDHGIFDRHFFSDLVGSAQRLQNGNTLSVEGDIGRVFEVDSTGQIVWEHLTDEFVTTPLELKIMYRAWRVRYSFAPAGL